MVRGLRMLAEWLEAGTQDSLSWLRWQHCFSWWFLQQLATGSWQGPDAAAQQVNFIKLRSTVHAMVLVQQQHQGLQQRSRLLC